MPTPNISNGFFPRTMLWAQEGLRKILRPTDGALREHTDCAIAITYQCNASCTYCYARTLRGQYSHMQHDTFKQALDWLAKQGKGKVMLVGGECTVHPEFPRFIQTLRGSGFRYALISNGLFAETMLRHIAREDVLYVLLNVHTDRTAEEDANARVNTNIRGLLRKGIKVILRANLGGHPHEAGSVIHLAKRHSLELNVVIVDNAKESSPASPHKHRARSNLISVVRQCIESGLAVEVGRPLLPCMFTDSDWHMLRERANARSVCNILTSGKRNSGPVINPDLSVYACLSVHHKASRGLLGYSTLEQIHQEFEPHCTRMMWVQPRFQACLACSLRTKKACQGGCLANKVGAQLSHEAT